MVYILAAPQVDMENGQRRAVSRPFREAFGIGIGVLW